MSFVSSFRAQKSFIVWVLKVMFEGGYYSNKMLSVIAFMQELNNLKDYIEFDEKNK